MSNEYTTTPTRWARYECKYVVSETVAREIRRAIAAYAEPDHYAARRPDEAYRIESLYLDTPDLRLFRETLDGRENRIKLRIRSYSRDLEAPVFLEVKRRLDRVVEKARARVDRGTAWAIAAGRPPPAPEHLAPGERENYDDFADLVLRTGARPVVNVGYWRQAYVGIYHPDVRVTFDRDLACCMPGDEHGEWLPIEQPRVVLELKFNNRYPGWMQDVIRRFELLRRSFSKYGHAVQAGRPAPEGYSRFLSRGLHA